MGTTKKEKTLKPEDKSNGGDDPVLRMVGVGRQLWSQEPGDEFIERLRSDDSAPARTNERLYDCGFSRSV